MKLHELEIGESGRVEGFGSGRNAYRRKLLAMGLTPGTLFTVVRHAPMGDPIELHIRGFRLSLRKDEASSVDVERASS